MSFWTEEDPKIWSKKWVGMWTVVGASLIASIPFLTFKAWTVAAGLGFGLPEAIALRRKLDAYPPLTYVIRKYLPVWFTFTGIYALTAAAGAYWLGFASPARIGALFGLLGWFTTHFTTTYAREFIEG